MFKSLFSSVPSFTATILLAPSTTAVPSATLTLLLKQCETFDCTTPLQPGWVNYLFGVHCDSRYKYSPNIKNQKTVYIWWPCVNQIGHWHIMYLVRRANQLSNKKFGDHKITKFTTIFVSTDQRTQKFKLCTSKTRILLLVSKREKKLY